MASMAQPHFPPPDFNAGEIHCCFKEFRSETTITFEVENIFDKVKADEEAKVNGHILVIVRLRAGVPIIRRS